MFSCQAGKKLLSFCASRLSDGSLEYVQYRYGQAKPELAIPPTQPFDGSAFNGEMFTAAHGGGETVSVRSGEYLYEIQTGWDMQSSKSDYAQVTILRGPKTVSKFRCKPLTELGLDASGLRALISKQGLKARSGQ